MSPEAMLRYARRRGSRVKWAIRAGGALLMWFGCTSLLSFLPALAGYLPFLGGVAQSLVGATTSLIALGGALATSALVIAAAWARFRPLHAAGLAATAVAAAFGQAAILRRSTAAARQQPLRCNLLLQRSYTAAHSSSSLNAAPVPRHTNHDLLPPIAIRAA